MLTVTISGDRTEGKTQLGIAINVLLTEFTNYEVKLEDFPVTAEHKKRIIRALNTTKLLDLTKLDTRDVFIRVIE